MRSKEKGTRNLWLRSFVVGPDTGQREGRSEDGREREGDKRKKKGRSFYPLVENRKLSK